MVVNKSLTLGAISVLALCLPNARAQTNIFPSTGNVGVQTTSPSALLQVGNGGTSGKLGIYSQDSAYGQLEIGNPNGAEASMLFAPGLTSFGSPSAAPVSSNGTAALWNVGAATYGTSYQHFSISNAGYGGPILSVLSNGNVGIGTQNPSSTLEVDGNITLTQGLTGAHITFPDGTTQSTAYTGNCAASGGDYAESVDVTGGKSDFEPGDIIVIDPDNPGHFLRSNTRYSALVAGIYSTKPGYVGRRQKTDPRLANNEIPMAMVGVVPTKVTTENGPIKVGDLLVTSSTPGYAMHGTDRSALTGAVVGKALGSLPSGSGVIEVLVSLQ